MSVPGNATSSVDMLRLEYPRTSEEIFSNAVTTNDPVEVINPAAWVRQMAGMYIQAQRDLRQYQEALGAQFDRQHERVRAIEASYNTLCGAMRYVYQQAQADATASREWIQTELIQAANAASNFTSDVWKEITAHAADAPRANYYQQVQTTRLDDAIALLSSANIQRNQQQTAFQNDVQQGAPQQTAIQLATGQQRLARESSVAQAARQPDAVNPASRQSPPRALSPVAAGGSGNGPPSTPLRRQPRASSPSPSAIRLATPEADGSHLEQVIARTVAAAVAATRATVPPTVPARARDAAPLMARFKMRDPGEFDGKPKSDFRSWWRMVEGYFRCYPDTLDAQRIAWVGSLLTNEAREWHLARELRTRLQDTWNAYSEAIQEQYLDPEEAATAYDEIAALRYKGDIKAYLVTFEALNHHAQITGQALRKMVNLALPTEIITMRFNQNPRPLLEDGPFLTATYEAGRHYESLKKLSQQKAALGRGDHSITGSGKAGAKGNGKEGKPDTSPTPAPSSTRSSGKKLYRSWKEALAGVSPTEVEAHKAAKAGCYRCGRDNHHSTECYAKTTIGGTPLPAAPRTAAAVDNRKRDAQSEGPEELPEAKTARTTAAVSRFDGEVPMWAQDSDSEGDF
jgi:hypothetical protein